MNKQQYNDAINMAVEAIVASVYNDPSKVFGGEWRRKGRKMICKKHLLTTGKDSHDGNGTYIDSACPHLICDGTDPRTNYDVINFVAEADGIERIEAIRRLASERGISMPSMYETQEQRKRREHRQQQERDVRARAISLTKDQPATPAGQPAKGMDRVRQYIAGRGLIDNSAGIMYISSDAADAEGKANFDATEAIIKERVNESSRPAGRGSLYKVVIPVYSRGQLAGLCYAALPEEMKEAEAKATAAGMKAPPKYRLASFSDAGTVVYGLRPAKSTRYPWQARTLVAVEGYFDAITAADALDEDVVAYLHNYISKEQADAIAAAGYTSCIIVPDYEGLTAKRTIAEGVNFQTEDATDSAKVLRDAGLSVFVADLKDQEHPEVKQDANSVSPDTLRQRVKEAVSPATFEVLRLADIYGEANDQRDHAEVKQRAIHAAASETDAATRRYLVEVVASAFFESRQEQAAAAVATETRKLEQQQAIDAERNERKQKAEAYRQAAEAIAAGDERTAAKLIQQGSTSSREAAKLNAFRRPELFDRVIAEAANRPKGIVLPYTATIGVAKPMPITLPPAGMIVVSAPSGHGKTRFIENMIVHVLQTTPADKRVIYVHFEESDAETIAHIISIIANTNLDYSNHWNAVLQLVANGRRQPWNTDQDVAAIMEAARVVRDWIDAERLILVDNEPASETITTAIMEAAEVGNLAAVFVDYAQKLKSDSAKFTTKKELMEWACDGVNSLAKQAAVPIILTSQLNRQAVSPWSLDIRMNGDATNIEQTAYMNLLCWNTKFLGNEAATPTTPPHIIDRIQAAGVRIGEPGHLLVKVAKNRTGQAGDVWSVLDFVENTGRITESVQQTKHLQNTWEI